MFIRKKTYNAIIAMAAAVDKRTTETIEAKDTIINAKQRVIDELEEKVADLQRRIDYHRNQAVKAKSAKKPNPAKPKQKTWNGKTEYKPLNNPFTKEQNNTQEQ